MYPTTPRFREVLLENSRTWANKIEVLYGGDLVTSLDVLVDGSVSVDDVAVRRSCDLRLVDINGVLTPSDARDLLAPKGTEVRIYKGLFVDGDYEFIPLGVFGIVKPEVSAHTAGTQLRIKGWDRVDAIRVRRFENAWPIVAATPTWQAISNIVTSRMSVATRITQSGNTTPEIVFDALSDPWDAVRSLAETDNLSAYFDPLGTLVIEPTVEVMTTATYVLGENSLLESVTRAINADQTYSGVIVRGEHPETGPIRSELWDTNPASPTYSAGPFGRRPFGFYSKLLDTQGKADASAATIFARITKMRQELEIYTIGTPGHDIGDVVQVIDPKSKTNGFYAVKGASIPIRPGKIRLRLIEAIGV